MKRASRPLTIPPAWRPMLLVGVSLAVVVVVAVMVSAAPARVASAGHSVGHVYWSDIAAYVDGMPIRSYAYDGRTLVVCEDLVNYGFHVNWSPTTRTLTMFTVTLPDAAPKYDGPGGQPGTIAGTVYSTDIETVVRGLHIPSYNLGGQTAIAIEDLGAVNPTAAQPGTWPFSDLGASPYGFSCKWDAEKRTISLFTLRPNCQTVCDLGKCHMGPLLDNGYLGYSLWERPLRLNGMTLVSGMSMVTLPIGNDFLPWAEVAEAMHVKWSWREDWNALYILPGESEPLKAVETEVQPTFQTLPGNSIGVWITILVNGERVKPAPAPAYLAVDAILYGGKIYVRCEAIAAALDLVYVKGDGFYSKTDSAVIWDATYEPYLGNNNGWVASATPSFFGGVPHGGYGAVTRSATEPITITFARKMDPATLISSVAVFYRTTTEDGRVHYQVVSDLYYPYAYDGNTNTLTLTPHEGIDLPKGAMVIVAIKPGVADAQGNHPAVGMKTGFYTPE